MVLRRKIVSHITDRNSGSLGDSSERKARETFFHQRILCFFKNALNAFVSFLCSLNPRRLVPIPIEGRGEDEPVGRGESQRTDVADHDHEAGQLLAARGDAVFGRLLH